VICLFECTGGPLAVILVGAIFVGSVETVWAGEVTPASGASPKRVYSDREAVELARGDELGRFNMGSTVILLLPPGAVVWDPHLRAGDPVRMGGRLGRLTQG
jgi:phosphatidylserine decarboxylase